MKDRREELWNILIRSGDHEHNVKSVRENKHEKCDNVEQERSKIMFHVCIVKVILQLRTWCNMRKMLQQKDRRWR